jgi:hypothetical protein
MRLSASHKHQFRVRARDGAGNMSPWRVGQAFVPRVRQEQSSAIEYVGSWVTVEGGGAYGGFLNRASAVGREAEFTFFGRRVAWLSTRGAFGTADVYVDGSLVTTVDLGQQDRRTRTVVWTMAWDAVEGHVVRIVVTDPRVDVDAFLFTN